MSIVAAVMLIFVFYSFIGVFVFSIFVYYAARPLYNRLSARVPSETAAAILALSVLALPLIVLVSYSLAIGIAELNRFAATVNFGPYQSTLQSLSDSPVAALQQLSEFQAVDFGLAQRLADQALASLGMILAVLFRVFVIFALSFYLLRDGGRLWEWAQSNFVTSDGPLHVCLKAIDNDFSSIFFGNILNAILTGVIGLFVYMLLNTFAPPWGQIPYPALLGLLGGVASLVPIFGTKIVYVPMTIYMLFRPGAGGTFWFVTIFFVVSLIIVDVIPDLILRPYITSRRLHIGLLMFAYVFGPVLFGWYGLFFGPIVLVVITHFAKHILPPLVAGDPL